MKIIKSIALFFFILNASAQDIKFDHITINEGLSNNKVVDIYQDKEGFMWFGTEDGLNRYDGFEFQSYRYHAKLNSGISHNNIKCISDDHKGDIWIGTQGGGLNKFDKITENFTHYMHEEGDSNTIINDEILAIFEDRAGNIWVGTDGGGLQLFDRDSESFINFNNDKASNTIGSVDAILTICEDHAENLWIGTWGGGLYKFDKSNKAFTHFPYPINGDSLQIYHVWAIKEDHYGILWIGTFGNQFRRFDPKTERYIEDITQVNDKTDSFSTVWDFDFGEDDLWMATDNGLFLLTTYGTIKQRFYHDDLNPNSLSSNNILSIFTDKSKNVWIGTDNGINFYRKNQKQFEVIGLNTTSENYLNNKNVLSIYQDIQYNLWVGTAKNGLIKIDPFDSHITQYHHDAVDSSSITKGSVKTIFQDSQTNIWIGTRYGLNKYNHTTDDFSHYLQTDTTENDIISICEDKYNNLWVATEDNGLYVFESNLKNYKRFIFPNDLPDKHLLTIYSDKNGTIWVGSRKGLSKFAYEENKFISYLHVIWDTTGLSNNLVQSIYFQNKFAENSLWIGTNGGLNKLNTETDVFTHYTENDGLANDNIQAIQEDIHGNIWFSTNKGISKLNPITGQIKNFNTQDGLVNNKFNLGSNNMSADGGRMYFGGTQGLNSFVPDSIKDNPIPPEIVFIDFKLFNESVDIKDDMSPINKPINYIDYIKLTYKQSVFSLHYTTLNYSAPEKIKYMYKMEGLNYDWIKSTQHFVNFTNLEPGNYTFKVKADNGDGIWSITERKIAIKIMPPWYKTLLFYILLSSIIVFISYKIYKWRVDRIKEDKAILQAKIAEGQKEIKKHIQELEIQKNDIKERDKSEQEIRFHNKGMAQLSEILSKNRDKLTDLCNEIITELVTHIDAEAGAIFIAKNIEAAKIYLYLIAEFSFSTTEKNNDTFEAGEGLVGTCFMEQKTIQLDNMPESYVFLESGLGKAPLKNIVLVPIIHDNETLGVIEIASLKSLESYKVSLVEKLSCNFASVLAITEANNKMHLMLEDNQNQAEELRAQEEELRQNIEEIQATNEDATRRENKMAQKIIQQEEEIKSLLAIVNSKE